MSSGNQNAYEFGEIYRNYQGYQQNQEDGARNFQPTHNPGVGQQRSYPSYAQGNTYSQQLYYQHQPPMVVHNAQQIYGNRMPPPAPPTFDYRQQPSLPGNLHPTWNAPFPPPHTPPTGSYNSSNISNNNNNYEDPIIPWRHYDQGAWRQPVPTASVQSHQQSPASSQRNIASPLPPKAPSPESAPPPSAVSKRPVESEGTSEGKDEEKETKKPVPIMVGKRRGGRVLPTGVVKKPRGETSTQGRTDAWGQYMAEVKKYKEQSCEEERKNRPLVK